MIEWYVVIKHLTIWLHPTGSTKYTLTNIVRSSVQWYSLRHFMEVLLLFMPSSCKLKGWRSKPHIKTVPMIVDYPLCRVLKCCWRIVPSCTNNTWSWYIVWIARIQKLVCINKVKTQYPSIVQSPYSSPRPPSPPPPNKTYKMEGKTWTSRKLYGNKINVWQGEGFGGETATTF